MENIANETFQFQQYRHIDGAVESVNLVRRNRRPELQFPPAIVEFPLYLEAEESPEYRELVDEVCQNLNEIERRTWMKIIDGRSILDRTASVIVAATLPAKLSIRAIARSARNVATMTRTAVALINASRRSLGSLHNLAEIPLPAVSAKSASYPAAGTSESLSQVFAANGHDRQVTREIGCAPLRFANPRPRLQVEP